jgi:hypothetical protein
MWQGEVMSVIQELEAACEVRAAIVTLEAVAALVPPLERAIRRVS